MPVIMIITFTTKAL